MAPRDRDRKVGSLLWKQVPSAAQVAVGEAGMGFKNAKWTALALSYSPHPPPNLSGGKNGPHLSYKVRIEGRDAGSGGGPV